MVTVEALNERGVANLPQGATGFTTIELKSNHLGRNSQVWDAVITHKESRKTIALFRSGLKSVAAGSIASS
jgi:hypothetical protein